MNINLNASMNEISEQQSLWRRYVALVKEYHDVKHKLFQKLGHDKGTKIVDFVRRGLSVKEETDVSLEAVEFLTQEAQMELFDDLFPLAIELDHNHFLNKAEQIILSLPKDWLREKLHEIAKPKLDGSENSISSGLLEITIQVDKHLAKQLAEKASSLPDEYSRDVGSYYLKKIDDE